MWAPSLLRRLSAVPRCLAVRSRSSRGHTHSVLQTRQNRQFLSSFVHNKASAQTTQNLTRPSPTLQFAPLSLGIPSQSAAKNNNFAGMGGNRQQVRWHGHSHGGHFDDGTVELTFVSLKDSSKTKTVDGFIGDNLLRCAQSHGIELEGACECSVACSTCHVILEDDVFDELPEATEEEDDMLDMAFGLTPTSRLGCQIIITDDMDGMEITLPAATRNMYVDGHVPQPH